MHKVIELLQGLFSDGYLLTGTLSSPVEKKNPVTKVSVRPITLTEQLHYQFTFHEATKVRHSNLSPSEAEAELINLLSNDYRQALLCSPAADYQIFVNPGNKARVLTHPPSKKSVNTSHNRKKNYIIPNNEPCTFLIRLGIMNKQGQVLPSRMGKFKQINRFLEMVDDVIGSLPTERELRIVDFGCGKSYLTFALYHYLHEQKGLNVKIIGLDLKADVVQHCNTIAQDLGWAPRLGFWVGDIKDYDRQEHVDLVVSLHACDTATDIALAKAVAWQSEVILSVPCCQHELLQQIENPTMRPLTKHGILKERLAALVTDSLRASALEIAGYNVQILEFIATEHTAKNLLIRAVRTHNARDAQRAKQEYLAFRDAWSLKNPFIETVFGTLLQDN